MAFLIIHIDDETEAESTKSYLEELLDSSGIGGDFIKSFSTARDLKDFAKDLEYEEYLED